MVVNKLPFEEFKNIYSRVPRLCVEIIVKTKGGVVLTKRGIVPYEGFWHIPGGTVLYGESVSEAVKRIAIEEVGIEIKIQKLINIIEYPSERKKRGYGQSIGIAFLCKVKSGKIPKVRNGEEIRKFKRMPRKMIPEQKEFIKRDVKL